MKKVLMILGGVFAALVLLAAAGFGVLAVKGRYLDRESKAYVDRVVPEILTRLDCQTLFQYASQELKAANTADEFEKIFTWFSKLGYFIAYQGAQGQAHLFFSPASGRQITANYQARAVFENGPALIKVAAVKKGTQWQILGFHIHSAVLTTP